VSIIDFETNELVYFDNSSNEADLMSISTTGFYNISVDEQTIAEREPCLLIGTMNGHILGYRIGLSESQGTRIRVEKHDLFLSDLTLPILSMYYFDSLGSLSVPHAELPGEWKPWRLGQPTQSLEKKEKEPHDYLLVMTARSLQLYLNATSQLITRFVLPDDSDLLFLKSTFIDWHGKAHVSYSNYFDL
jgi:hypothetical protein